MAGKTHNNSSSELQAPAWKTAALLMFAALLLFAIKNPIVLHQLEASVQPKSAEPSLIIQIPVSNVAVASTIQGVVAEQSM
jgi:hypothetical protein